MTGSNAVYDIIQTIGGYVIRKTVVNGYGRRVAWYVARIYRGNVTWYRDSIWGKVYATERAAQAVIDRIKTGEVN